VDVSAASTLLVDDARLPRLRLVEAIDVAEARLAVVLLQHIGHERNALFNGVGCLGAARVGLNPAGCDNEPGTTIYAAVRQLR
jgi:hypothetical protein